MAARRLVSIRVLGQEYRIRTDADPAELQRVAGLVDETMGRLRDRTGAVDSLDLAMMTAVNLARDLLAERTARRSGSAPADRVRKLSERIEAALQDGPSVSPC
jgi:cell division protein ZapA (FtsZ GTPase activity inhibitor)